METSKKYTVTTGRICLEIKTLLETYQPVNPFFLADNLNIPYHYVNFREKLKGKNIVYDEEIIILLK